MSKADPQLEVHRYRRSRLGMSKTQAQSMSRP